MTRKRFFSMRLPFGMYIHYARGGKIGESKPAYGKGLVHYNRRRKLVARTVRNFFGEPNHYDIQGGCAGYSRKGGQGKYVHFDRNGSVVGYTYAVLGILFVTALNPKSYVLKI